MKYAFHFNPGDEGIGRPWHLVPQQAIYRALLADPTWSGSTGVSLGDIILPDVIPEAREGTLDAEKRAELFYLRVGEWMGSANRSDIDVERLLEVIRQRLFVICVDSIPQMAADRIHAALAAHSFYLGYLEVDEANPVHYALYRGLIRPGRIVGREFRVFAISLDPADDDALEWKLEEYRALGTFKNVSFELSGGRYTILDPEDDFEHARKIAEARRFAVNYFGATADEVITLYRDAVPGFADAIWTLFDTLSRAQTEDQFAHVALSCRRLVDRVADTLFPPVDGDEKLGPGKTRNRLRAFVTARISSNKDRELIEAEIEGLFDRLTALSGLANKGIHAEARRAEVRRVAVRTMLFLDDLASMSGGALPMTIAPISNEEFNRVAFGEGPESWRRR
jgi:hypothetical protein